MNRSLVVAIFLHFDQVLTGSIPFHGVRPMDLGFEVIEGLRPAKPENASSIGFSDSLWSFVERCWDGDMNLRPKVAEVVTHLGEAAANWNEPMPPFPRTKIIAPDFKEQTSDSAPHREFEILFFLILFIEPRFRRNPRTVFGWPHRESHRLASYHQLWAIQQPERTIHSAQRSATRTSGGRC